MTRYLSACVLGLCLMSCGSSEPPFGKMISLPLPLSPEERAENHRNELKTLNETLANISAILKPLEKLKDEGYPRKAASLQGTVNIMESGSEGVSGGSVNSENSGSESRSGSGSATSSVYEIASGSESMSEARTGTEEGGLDTAESFTGGQAHEFTNRQYSGHVYYWGNSVSGICASRIHRGILYMVNDDEDENPYIYMLDTKDHGKMISMIRLNVHKGDWEDIACAPCDDDLNDHCIYISDTGKKDGKQLNLIYKIREPQDPLQASDDFYDKHYMETIHYYYYDDINSVETIEYDTNSYSYMSNVQTLMVSPKGRIFVMPKVKYSYSKPLYEVTQSKDKTWKLVKICSNVKLDTKRYGPLGGDVSPDGTGWLFKMEDKVFYFYVEDMSKLASVLSSTNTRVDAPYWKEIYSGAIAFSATGGSYYTISEGRNEPIYRYFILS